MGAMQDPRYPGCMTNALIGLQYRIVMPAQSYEWLLWPDDGTASMNIERKADYIFRRRCRNFATGESKNSAEARIFIRIRFGFDWKIRNKIWNKCELPRDFSIRGNFMRIFRIDINNAKAGLYLRLFPNFVLLPVCKMSLHTSQFYTFCIFFIPPSLPPFMLIHFAFTFSFVDVKNLLDSPKIA